MNLIHVYTCMKRLLSLNMQVHVNTGINFTNISFTCSFFDGRSILTSAFILLSKYGLMVSLNTQAHL